MKIPENERPVFKLISEKLDKCISRNLQNIFCIDLQNDCNCSVEKYSTDGKKKILFVNQDLEIDSIQEQNILLPMIASLNDAVIVSLLQKTFEDIEIKSKDVSKDEFYYREFSFNDKMYLIPDPEYFGLITVNLYGFGAFTITDHIVAL